MAANGTVSVGTSATLICPSSPVVTLQNNGTTAVEVGGSGVTTGSPVVTLPPSMTEPVIIDAARLGLLTGPIYGISTVAAQSVVYHSEAYGA